MIKAKQFASANAAAAPDDGDQSTDEINTADGGDVWMAMAATPCPNDLLEWLIDPGATHHLCSNRDLLAGLEPAYLPIRVANGAVLKATAKGSAQVHFTNGIKDSVM